MLDQRYYNRPNYPFTASQWQELEHQVLAFRYLISGLSVPPDLMSSIIRSPSNPSSPRLFPQLQPLPGWGCFQVGYGRKVDSEPGRCRRTDGKKWRCSKEAHPDSRYCEKHMHRSKSKVKKQLEALNSSTNNKTNTSSPSKPSNTALISSFPYPAVSSSVSQSHDNVSSYPRQTQASNFYPFLSAQSCSTDQDNNSAHWLLDSELYDQPRKKEIRYPYEMKGEFSLTSSSRYNDSTYQDNGYNVNEMHKESSVGMDQEHETQNLFRHFLGDWPMKLKSSPAVGVYSTSTRN